MERPKRSAENAERIANLLRDNPGVAMTVGDITGKTGLPSDDLAAHMSVETDTTAGGFHVYPFPAQVQRGTMAL
ncbi:MAG TPA: hypothetical protein VLA19_07340 [Herpetosiphonaceae bacterium]|nr:hypothetical protein [Herpetosiphonaceae bacterium]